MDRTAAHAALAALLVAVACAGSAQALGSQFFVTPSGSPSGDGSLNRPWDLATALAGPAAVHPGDTIWLRGGTYLAALAPGGRFLCGLRGTDAAPITVVQYPGERATIDIKGSTMGLFFTNSPNPAGAAYVNFKDFEVTNSDTYRRPNMPVGIFVRLSDHLKFINLVVHDTGEGFALTTDATNTEVYGCLVYYNGASAGQEHGIYIQNVSGYKKAIDNIIFNNFGYGIHAYPHLEDNVLLNTSLIGNFAFNNGMLGSSTPSPDILLGGQSVAISPVVDGNATYKASPGNLWNNRFGYSAGCTNPTMTNNYFVGTTIWTGCTSGLELTGNTFYGFALFQPAYNASTTPLNLNVFPNNTYTTVRPTGTRVFVRPNQYESGRANIAVYNWDLVSAVSVDLSDVLTVGSVYQIRNAQDFLAAPVLTGTYDGNPVDIPMTGLSVTTPIGFGQSPPTAQEFNVFVLITTRFGRVLPEPPPRLPNRPRKIDPRDSATR